MSGPEPRPQRRRRRGGENRVLLRHERPRPPHGILCYGVYYAIS